MTKDRIGILAIVGVLLLLIGGFTGYKLKKCSIVVNTVTTIDTIYRNVQIRDTIIKTKPITKTIIKEIVKQVLVSSGDTTFLNYPEWEQEDNLEYEGLNIDIVDRGNCNGVIERKANFSGSLKEQIVTKETIKSVIISPPLISLTAGASASFSNRWHAFDVGPAIGLSLRKKHTLNYSYQINTSTHTITLLTHIR